MKIGLEIHVQLPTKSKLFCSCSTSGSTPNSSVCPICLGLPGSRPFLNRQALEMGVLIAKFLNCKISDKVWFARKTYFYPDLPKNFQITQYDSPLGVDGHFMIGDKNVGIWRAHIEEDPGRIKRVGRSGEEVALVDYNRSGIPLVEIVTAPDLSSPAEARDFLTDLIIELRHLIDVTGAEQTMCLAIPGQVVSIDSAQADVDFGGVVRKVNVSLVDAKIGEWVVVHAGFAIEKMDEGEARETLKLWSEMLDQEEELSQ